MSEVAGLKTLIGQGAPADIGLFEKAADIIMFQYTFSGVTYVAAIRAGVGGWVPVDVQTDADTTLDSALTLVGTLGAGRILVMTATYDMSSQHTLTQHNLSIVGEGKNKTIFNVTANVALFYCTVGANPMFLTFADFSVVLTEAPGDEVGVVSAFWLLAATDLLFSNILVYDAWTIADPAPVGTSNAFRIGNWAADFGNITRCWMVNCEADGRGVRNFGPIVAAGWDTGFIDNCRFKARDSDVAISAPFAASVLIHRILTVRFSHCVIEYGHHNGVFWSDGSGTGFYSEDVAFVACTLRNNGDDAMDPNYNFDMSVIGCTFIDNQYEMVSFEDGCSRCRVIGCKTNTRRVGVGDCTRIVIADNEFIRATRGTLGVRVFAGSSLVTITGNQISGAFVSIDIDTASLVIVTGNFLEPIAYHDRAIAVDDSTYVIFTSNIIYGSTANAIWAIQEIGTSDYNIFSWNIFRTADGNDFYARFVGANTIVENNLGDPMRDEDGSMTGAVGTAFSYDRQSGQVINISTAAVARVVGAVTYSRRYPLGVTPKITVTLVDVAPAVRIDTVQVDTVTPTGFNWAVNVTTLFAASTCKLDWKARPTHVMYD